MASKKPASTKETYKLFQKRNGRWAVLGDNGKYINAADKVKILEQKGLVKILKKKAGEAPAQ